MLKRSLKQEDEEEKNISSEQENEEEVGSSSKIPRLTCSKCGYQNTSYYQFSNHCYSHNVCHKCSAEYHEKDELLQHLRDVHRRKIKCETCNQSKLFLQSHQKLCKVRKTKKSLKIPRKRKKHECKVCSYVAKNGSHLTKHSYQHNLCYRLNCYKQFQDKPSLLSHLSQVHKKAIDCHKCNKKWLHLQSHLRSCKPEQQQQRNELVCAICDFKTNGANLMTKHSYKHNNCYKCQMDFEDRDQLLVHIEQSHDNKSVKCPKCSKLFLRLREHVQSCDPTRTKYPKKMKSCVNCGYTSDNDYNFWIHNWTHKNCIRCDKQFDQEDDFADHMLSFHQKKLQCDVCKYLFTSTIQCGKHILKKKCDTSNIKHPKEMRSCVSCSYTSDDYYKFWLHNWTHKNCTRCNKLFDQEDDFAEHMFIVHQKKLKCDICKYLFTSTMQCKKHILKKKCDTLNIKHPKEMRSCISCSYTSDTYNRFWIHNWSHKNCTHCDKQFDKEGEFAEHMFHIHGKKLQCDVCKHLFASTIQCKKHMTRKTCDTTSNIKHPKEMRSCGNCSYTSDKYHKFWIHNWSHKNCTHCDKQFDIGDEFAEHMLNIHGKKLQCDACRHVFTKTIQCKIHILNKTCDSSKSKIKLLKEVKSCEHCPFTTFDVLRMSTHMYKHNHCQNCNESFPDRNCLLKHLAKCQQIKVKCDRCGNNFLFLKSHLKTCQTQNMSNSRRKSCAKCEFSTTKMKRMVAHSYNHNMCIQCQMEFQDRDSLLVHVGQVHAKTSLQCPKCNKLFLYLKSHLKTCDPSIIKLPKEMKSCAHCPYKSDNDYKFWIHNWSHKNCTRCDKQFDQEDNDFADHMFRMHERKLQCDVCKHVFASASHCRRHILNKTCDTSINKSPKQLLHCKYCSYTTDSIRMSRHMHKHNHCIECNEQFNDRNTLLQHLLEFHETKVKCGYCGQLFLNLRIHLKICQNEKKSIRKLKSCPKCPFSTTKIEKLISHSYKHNACIKCKLNFENRAELLQHLKQVHDRVIECQTCNKNWLYLFFHKKKCDAKYILNCQKCSYTTTDDFTLMRHYYKHECCKKCDIEYKNRAELLNHLSEIHVASVKCPKCEGIFLHLASHTRNCLNGKKRLSFQSEIACTRCKFMANGVDSIKKHSYKHNVCYECNQIKFENRDQLFDHIQQLHANMNIKCPKCNQLFLYLRVHLKTCDPSIIRNNSKQNQACENCSYTSDDDYRFWIHNWTHKRCTRCDKQFDVEDQFIEHMQKIHHKKLQCDNCEKIFTTSSQCKKHIDRNRCSEIGTIYNKADMNCTKCAYVGRNPADIIRHYLKHNVCFKCKEEFSSKATLMNHLSEIHKRIIKCNKCDQNWLYLQSHLRSCQKSTILKKLRCDNCEKLFTTSSKCKRHMIRNKCSENNPGMLAQGEIHCKICSYKTNGSYLMTRHSYKHNSCFKCQQDFKDRNDLLHHIEIMHTNISVKCVRCGNNFLHLKEHIKSCDPSIIKPMKKKLLHTCKVCGFKSKSFGVWKHAFSHLICIKCDMEFKSRVTLTDHISQFHSLKCPKCPYNAVKREKLLVHGFQHNYCLKCNIDFLSKDELLNHLSDIHGRKIKCHKCDKNWIYLNSHLKSCDPSIVKYNQELKNCNHCSFSSNRDYRYWTHNWTHKNCTRCDKQFDNEDDFAEHMFTSHNKNIQCSTCKKLFSTMKRCTEHMDKNQCSINTKPVVKCEVCGYNSQSYKVWLHSFSHQICTKCNLDFKSEDDLLNHLSDTHGRKTKCNKCNKNWTHLKIHIKRCNPSIIKYNNKELKNCNYCSFSSNDDHRFWTHNWTHKNCTRCNKHFDLEDDFAEHLFISHHRKIQCSTCKKLFSTMKRCREHMDKNQCSIMTSAVKPVVKCKVCGFESQSYKVWQHCFKHQICTKCNLDFQSENDFANHMSKIHKLNFKCQKCGKVYLSIEGCKHHMKKCKDKCNECDYQTTSKNALWVHNYAMHQSCTKCETKKFPSTNSFLEHMVNKHGINLKCENCDQIFKWTKRKKEHEKSCTAVTKEHFKEESKKESFDDTTNLINPKVEKIESLVESDGPLEESSNCLTNTSDFSEPKIEIIENLVEAVEPLPQQDESCDFFDTSDFIEPKIEIIEHTVEESDDAVPKKTPTPQQPPPQKKMKFDCDICDAYKTNDWFKLWIHNQEQHLEMSFFTCDLCTFESESKEGIFDHRIRGHP